MDGKNYSAVPPPPSLSSPGKGSAPLDFNDALSKARAIAEKLKQQSSVAAAASVSATVDSTPSYSSGTKRGYNDDDRDDYRSSSATRSYGSYQDDRDSKRSAYDSGSSRPAYGNNDSRRFGLGSDERKPYGQSYGGGHSEEYSVPNHMVGLLIGKGGENLKKIERMSGVSKVQFSNDATGSERQVHLTGEPDQISIARDMIRQMVEDAQNNDTNRFTGAGGVGGGNGFGRPDYQGAPQGGGHTISIKIPVTKVGLVIGRGGETIRDFEERSKAKILIASDGSGDINNERMINLVGDENAVQFAKTLIEDIVFGSNNVIPSRNNWAHQTQPYGNGSGGFEQQGGYAPNNSYGVNRMGRPDDERIFVSVPASSVGLIIGRGGETVRALQEQSGARVKVDPTNDPNSEERIVNISGDPKCVAIAKQLVEDKVAEATRSAGGRYGGYNNDSYSRGGNSGGYKSQNQDYGQQGGYQQGGNEGYDYSQYSQYYAQYGYGQSGQEGEGYQQYPGYQQYAGYNEQVPGTESSAPPPPPPPSGSDDRKPSDASNKDEETSGSNDTSVDPSAYYAQYYGGQQTTPEQQQAYYQWYQQYYGQQQQQQQQQSYDSYDQQEQQQDQSQQDQSQQNNESSSKQQYSDVDGEPIDDNTKDSKETNKE